MVRLVKKLKSAITGNLEPVFSQTLLDYLEDPVFVKNDRHEWVFANKAFREFIGSDELIGKTDADFLPGSNSLLLRTRQIDQQAARRWRSFFVMHKQQ